MAAPRSSPEAVAESASSTEDKPPARARALDVVARALLVSAALLLLALALTPRSLLHRTDVHVVVRLTGALEECTLMALAFALPFWLLGRTRSRPARFLSAALLTSYLVWLVLSWALFFGTGDFLTPEALSFAWGSGLQLIKHFLEFNPVVFLGLPLVVAALGVSVFLLAERQKPGFRPRTSGVLLCVHVALLLAAESASAMVLVSTTTFSQGHVEGNPTLVSDAWRRYALREVGPLKLLASLGFDLATGSGEKWPEPILPLPEFERPRITSAAYQASVPKDAPRYNVIVLVVESLRHDALRLLGGTDVVMPVVEELAKSSVVMARAYAQATFSTPTDPTIVSGQHPLRSAHYSDYPGRIAYPRLLLWDLLGPRGYRTAVISSQDERWGGMLNFLRTESLGHVFHAETYHGRYRPEDEGFLDWGKSFERSGKIDDAETMSELIRFVKASQEPAVIYTNLQNSHFPYRFPPGDAPFQPVETDAAVTFAYTPPEGLPAIWNRYRNALHFIDGQIGRLIQALQETGKWDQTILVITGDTGQAFGEHGRTGHGTSPYEEVVHVPMIVHAPNLEPRVSKRLSQQLDIVPTVVELLGLPPHPALAGNSLLSGGEEPVFIATISPARREIAVIEGKHKLIVDGFGKRELYDLETDPAEKRNLWGLDQRLGAHLENLVAAFRRAQLRYYARPERWKREYAPALFP